MAREVVCVDKDSSGPNDCRCITRIGYQILSTTRHNSPEEVYDDIEYNGKEYYVKEGNSRVELLTATTDDGTKYVRTERTNTKEDNLLQQKSC